MSVLYNCLSCGHAASQAELGAVGATATCPQCGRDMYKSQEQGGGLVAGGRGGRGGARTTTALPSRYGGGGSVSSYRDDDYDDEDEDYNPVLLRHTPLVVILGFIFSFIPLICFAALAISIMGLRLVNDNPQGLRGKGLAIAGIALSSLMSLLTVVLIATAKG